MILENRLSPVRRIFLPEGDLDEGSGEAWTSLLQEYPESRSALARDLLFAGHGGVDAGLQGDSRQPLAARSGRLLPDR